MIISKFMTQDVERRWIWLVCAFLFLATIMLFDQTFQFDFALFDDDRIITGHPQLYSYGSILERISQIVFLDYPREEPLIVRDLSWLLDSLIFGFNRPFGYHFGNVLYHAITVILAFLLFLRLTNFGTAVLTMVIVLGLAAQVEPVAWIMGRKDILSSMFALLSILLFLGFRDRNLGKKKYWSYFGSIVFAVAAYLSKINIVVLPGVLFLCTMINHKEIVQKGFKAHELMSITRQTIIQLLPFFLIAVIIFIWYRAVLDDFGMFDRTFDYSPGYYWHLLFVLNPLILLEYLDIIFFPEQLSAFYTYSSIYTDFPITDISLALFIIALTIAAIIFLWLYNRVSCLLFICFLVLMLPYGNWVNFGFLYANRYVYFSSMFLIASVGNLVSAPLALRQGKWIKLAIGIILGLIFAVNLNYRSEYIDVWKNGETLWTYDTSLPNAPINAFNNLTAFYIGKSEISLAEEKNYWLEKAQASNNKTLNLEWPVWQQQWLAVTYFYKGLILKFTNAPIEDQLAAFLAVVDVAPRYSDALRAVVESYHKMANEETDQETRVKLAKEALSYLRRLLDLHQKSRLSTMDRQNLVAGLKADFPDLDLPESERMSDQ